MSYTDKNKDLYYLDDLSDYKVASGYPDVRGWVVKDLNNRPVGKVDGLLASKTAERVVYLDVEVDKDLIAEGHKTYGTPAKEGVHEFTKKDGHTHLIVPIGLVTLDDDDNEVHTKRIDRATFAQAERFNKDSSFDPDYEVTLYRLYTGDTNRDDVTYDDQFYYRKEFETPRTRNTTR